MSFITQLDSASTPKLEALMHRHLLGPGISIKVRFFGSCARCSRYLLALMPPLDLAS